MHIPTLEDEPELFSHLHWAWEAFSELNYRRGLSMSGPIPISMEAIEAYARFRDITASGERDRLLRYIRVLDQEWMTNHYDKQKKQRGDNPADVPKPRKFHHPR